MKFHRMILAAAAIAGCGGPALAQDRDITVVLSAPVDVVEPCHMNATRNVGLVIRQNIVEPLTVLNPADSTPQPLLATGWEQKDANTWRVTLRQGVTFHDGTPFNAEAVKQAITRLFTPDLQCRDKIRLFGDDTMSVNIIDDHTVEFVTQKPSPLLPISLASIGMTAPSTDMNGAERHPIGTGPYVFGEWDPTTSLVYTRNEDYWGDKPQVEKVTYIWRSEGALRAQMVAVGEADIGLQISPQDATDPETDYGYLNADTLRARIFMDKSPLSDLRVRKALNLAIDRDALIGSVLSSGTIPASQYMLPSVSGYDPALKPWPYDPEQAKTLLDAAKADGVDVAVPIRVFATASQIANATEVFETLVSYWQQVGLNVQLQLVDQVQLAAIRRKPYPDPRDVATMVMETHDNTSGDAVFTMIVYYSSAGQLGNFSDPKVDEMIDKARGLTGDERRTMFEEINRYVHDEIVPDVILAHLESYIRVGPRINYKPDFTTEARLKVQDITFK